MTVTTRPGRAAALLVLCLSGIDPWATINPNADWASWKTGWPWDTPFIHGWVEYNWSKTAKGAGDWSTVYDQSRAADNHLGDYGAKKHYNGWSDDLKKWVDNAHTEMTTLWEESRKHR
jgi:hypothetical protein